MRPPRVIAFALVLAVVCSVFATGRVVCAQEVSGVRRYVVAPGDTVSSIALHLGVTVHALADRNHLVEPYALRVGRALRIPSSVLPGILRTLPRIDAPPATTPAPSPPAHATAPAPPSHTHRTAAPTREPWGHVRHPGTVRLVREWNDEHLTVNLHRVSRAALRRLEHFLRFNDGRHHPIHPRLVHQLATVSDHFGGRVLHVVSGYRPFRRGQYTAHSNHNVGRAMDFRIEGVSNRALRDFCRTLPATGCGFYPRSVFVHMDVRETSATWVDWSRPGQRPQYGREDRPPENNHATSPPAATAPPTSTPEGDESVDDVADDDQHVRTTPPPADDDTPVEPVHTPPDTHEAHDAREAAEPPLPGQPAPAPTVPATP